MIAQECSLPDCSKRVNRSAGFCPMHYQRMRLHGSTEYVTPPETAAERAERFWRKVDKTAGCWQWTAGLAGSGYGQFSVLGRDVPSHRVAYELSVGPIPAGQVLDHICHNITCVNPSHLRLATSKQNAENRSGPNRQSASGVRGVSLHRSRRWVGQVTHNYVRHAKYFDTQEEAAAFVTEKRKELFTHTIERKSA
jgi:hypothetical protein